MSDPPPSSFTELNTLPFKDKNTPKWHFWYKTLLTLVLQSFIMNKRKEEKLKKKILSRVLPRFVKIYLFLFENKDIAEIIWKVILEFLSWSFHFWEQSYAEKIDIIFFSNLFSSLLKKLGSMIWKKIFKILYSLHSC